MWQTVLDMINSVQPADGEEQVVMVTQLRLDLPFELVLRRDSSGPAIYGDFPRWRWRTAFDLEPGRMKLLVVQTGAQ